MSVDRTSPCYDMVATTRRSWSKKQKQAIVAEVAAGGATLSEVARRHGIHASLLFRWRRTLGPMLGAPSRANAITSSTPAATPSFIPVMLPPPLSSATPPARPGGIEIVLDGGRTVRVGSDVDMGLLVRIIDALEKSR